MVFVHDFCIFFSIYKYHTQGRRRQQGLRW